MDTFDYDESQGERKIVTRVAVGIYQPASWDITKKALAESALTTSFNPNVDSTGNLTHNSIVQCLQTNGILPRMQYSHLSSEPDFVHTARSSLIKLASKVLLFEFSYRLLECNKYINFIL